MRRLGRLRGLGGVIIESPGSPFIPVKLLLRLRTMTHQKSFPHASGPENRSQRAKRAPFTAGERQKGAAWCKSCSFKRTKLRLPYPVVYWGRGGFPGLEKASMLGALACMCLCSRAECRMRLVELAAIARST